MEITRKTQNKITELLIAKDISEKNAMELSNQICDLLEGETTVSAIQGIIPIQSTPQVQNAPVVAKASTETLPGGKAKLIPGTKYPDGYVNSKGQFVPADMSCIGGWKDEDGKILPESYGVG